MLLKAAAAESKGLSFPEWTETLKQSFGESLESMPVQEDSIQLITCHGAKGLEWDTVIIPFMFRKISRRGSSYPYVYDDKRKQTTTVVFGKDWLDEKDEEHIKTGLAHENQRLLYVAMTRARHSLVFADDSTLFLSQKDSFATCLDITEKAQPETWAALPREITAISADLKPGVTVEKETEIIPAQHGIEAIGKPLSSQSIEKALKHANKFPHRILPHSLAEHGNQAEPEKERDIDPEWTTGTGNTALRYGLWWHSLFAKINCKHKESWNNSFEAELKSSPLPERARKEWTLFLDSEIAETLSMPNLVIHTEIPFLTPLSDDQCVEGFIDLAAFEPKKNEWLVLDWKTNEIDASALDELQRVYEPQLREYAEAIRTIVGQGASVKSALYSTSCGKVVYIT